MVKVLEAKGAMRAALSLCLLLQLVASVAQADTFTGRASVIDGDTIEIHGVRIRLQGIDAPESRQVCADQNNQPYRCGQVAALALSNWIGQRTVECRAEGVDRYNRQLAKCFVADEDMQAWLVESGLALAFRRYSLDYVPQEEKARASSRGVWAGTFEAPWEWRRHH